MKLEELCVSLDLAKKLKEIGYNQENHPFYWFHYTEDGWIVQWKGECNMIFQPGDEELIAAPMAGELLELLPNYIFLNGHQKQLVIFKHTRKFFVAYRNINEERYYQEETFCCGENDKTLSNALAKMIIHLKQNGLMPENK